MSQSERRDRIVEYLRIKPSSFGQIHTSQIAISRSETVDILPERREALKRSLTEQGTNLIPLIVRRIEDENEEEDYEVVYGADWCLVAKELDIEKLWAWVFDFTDEQANIAKAEMEQLGNLEFSPHPSLLGDKREFENILLSTNLVKAKINTLTKIVEKIESDLSLLKETFVSKLDKLEIKIDSLIKPPSLLLNLLTASQDELKKEMSRIGGTKRDIDAAWKAIEYWRKENRKLTWDNLRKSTLTGKDKIEKFGKETYKKLQQIGSI
jgi:hypothetical protein